MDRYTEALRKILDHHILLLSSVASVPRRPSIVRLLSGRTNTIERLELLAARLEADPGQDRSTTSAGLHVASRSPQPQPKPRRARSVQPESDQHPTESPDAPRARCCPAPLPRSPSCNALPSSRSRAPRVRARRAAGWSCTPAAHVAAAISPATITPSPARASANSHAPLPKQAAMATPAATAPMTTSAATRYSGRCRRSRSETDSPSCWLERDIDGAGRAGTSCCRIPRPHHLFLLLAAPAVGRGSHHRPPVWRASDAGGRGRSHNHHDGRP